MPSYWGYNSYVVTRQNKTLLSPRNSAGAVLTQVVVLLVKQMDVLSDLLMIFYSKQINESGHSNAVCKLIKLQTTSKGLPVVCCLMLHLFNDVKYKRKIKEVTRMSDDNPRKIISTIRSDVLLKDEEYDSYS
ncbi:hypothetical protein BpHYR1_000942 [Brachionus plicatilis]|uniref:Uncharacterized protein n=1 Tax=Brachionus plicatilis TaxID=10195 RepID=A0A3M7QCB1_BRAPC|nr:hypothetical protein BpHYR1_000942 [Brachionus plicatilis]